MDPKRNPCGTVLESAKHKQGMLTGLVATSRITHATPASFSSHVVDRNNENQIAIQQIGDNPLGRSVDLMFGGGYCHYIPKSLEGGCRNDGRNLFGEGQKKYNWTTMIYNNRDTFDALPIHSTVLPAISLFSSDVNIYYFKKVVFVLILFTTISIWPMKLIGTQSRNLVYQKCQKKH